MMEFAIIGLGYVGLSMATLLSRRYKVVAVDIVKEKIDKVNAGISPIDDKEISECLGKGNLNLHATDDYKEISNADFVILATPTNYNPDTKCFDISILESSLKSVLEHNQKAAIVIKSTIPIGYTRSKAEEAGLKDRLLYSPEFLREGRALFDNLHPSRIIAGIPDDNPTAIKNAETFVSVLKECSLEPGVETCIMGSTEAESVKLFSNSYLAMRVAFFNELDSFAESNGLSAKEIIKGVCLDPRIGDYYNNPSFGYGGYCLPKDTKQLLSNYVDVPNSLIRAIVESNSLRKSFISEKIIGHIEKNGCKRVGIYRLTMKSNSDNYRESCILDIMDALSDTSAEVVVYEPTYDGDTYRDFKVIKDFTAFKSMCDMIITNRYSNELDDVRDKVYSRDIFMRD